MKRSAQLATRCAALLVAPMAVLAASPAAVFAQTSAPAAPQPSTPQPVAPQPTAPQAAGPAVSQPAVTPEPMPRTQIYYHAGAWDAFSGQTAKAVPVCGVGTSNAATGGALSIRFDIGGTDTVFADSKPGWSIPDGTRITVTMQVGLNPPWTVHGIGNHQTIEWTLDRNAIQTFDQQFRGADSMTLSYPDGNEPPWRISLTGSSAISDTFGRCVVDLNSQYQASRSRAGAPAAATQPFSQAHAANTAPAH